MIALNDNPLPEAFCFALGLEDTWTWEHCVDGWCTELVEGLWTEVKSSSSSKILIQLRKVKRTMVMQPYWLSLICKNVETEPPLLYVSLTDLGVCLEPIEHCFNATKNMLLCWFKVVNQFCRLVYPKESARKFVSIILELEVKMLTLQNSKHSCR